MDRLEFLVAVVVILLLVVGIVLQFIVGGGLGSNINTLKSSVSTSGLATSAQLANSTSGIQSSISGSASQQQSDNQDIEANISQDIISSTNNLSSLISRSASNSMASSINANLSRLNATISSELSSLDYYLYFLNTSGFSRNVISGNAIVLNDSQYDIPANSYYYGQLATGFANRINYTANTTIYLEILTPSQFAAFASGNPYGTQATYIDSGLSIWFNASENCNQYMYVLTDSGNPFNVVVDQSEVYNPSSSLTGVC